MKKILLTNPNALDLIEREANRFANRGEIAA
jgi:hypothetical protein